MTQLMDLILKTDNLTFSPHLDNTYHRLVSEYHKSLESRSLLQETIPLKCLSIEPCSVNEVRVFIEKIHYSHNINGVKISQCFSVKYGDMLVGGVIYGALSTTAWKKFADNENKVLELRRLVLLDEVEKTSESFVIGKTLRYIKHNYPDVDYVVSYADPGHGHVGIIYKASNFKFIGMSGKDYGFLDPDNGKIYHSRALRTKYKGEYKPFVKKLREKLDAGLLTKIELPAKYCYVYNMKRRRGELKNGKKNSL